MEEERPERKKVVIVGAGIAGLVTARHLLGESVPGSSFARRGPLVAPYDLAVLDARSRPGGRMHTVRFGGTAIDAGAAWVHGTEGGQPLMDLAAAAGVVLQTVCPANPWMLPEVGLEGEVRLDGVVIPSDVWHRALATSKVWMAEIGRVASGVRPATRKVDAAAFDALQCREDASVADALDLLGLPPQGTNALDSLGLCLIEYWMGGSLSDIALAEWASEDQEEEDLPQDHGPEPSKRMDIPATAQGASASASASAGPSIEDEEGNLSACGDFPGPHAMPREGYSQIIDWLAGPLAAQGCLRLNEEVKTVAWSVNPLSPPGPGTEQRSDAPADAPVEQRMVRVVTDHAVIDAEAVVITVPLGVLKANKPRFQPPLPPPKREALARLGSAIYKKVWLEFREPFWPPEATFIACGFSLGALTPQLTSAPVRAFGDDPSSTVQGGSLPAFLLLDNLFHAKGVPVLEAVLTGALGTWACGRSDAEITTQILALVQRSFGGMEVVGTPVSSHITRWEEDPLALCAYSFTAAGASEDDITALAEPLVPALFFAGEHTSVEYQGSVHGAFLSGDRVAQEVVGVLHRTSNPPRSSYANSSSTGTAPGNGIGILPCPRSTRSRL